MMGCPVGARPAFQPLPCPELVEGRVLNLSKGRRGKTEGETTPELHPARMQISKRSPRRGQRPSGGTKMRASPEPGRAGPIHAMAPHNEETQMKIVLFNDYKPGLLKGENVVDISSQV